ncbi:MAG: restriction endonuclease subunit S [Marinagarivorans sp.]|nr:restriction endonuclease subunit S [Marinagarivorans sp.]
MTNLSFMEKLLDGVDVKWKTLGDVAQYEQPTKYLVASTNYSDEFHTPVLTAGKTFILGYTDEVSGIYKASETPVIIFDDFTTANKWVDFDFKAKSSAMKMISSGDEDRFLIKYIYYWLNTLPSELVDGDHKRQWIGNFSNKKIPIPCPENPKKSLEIQAEIVRILDAFTELTARKKQYNYYRDQLLSFEDGEVEWKMLGEVAAYSRTRISSEQVDSKNYVGVDNLLQNRAGKTESNYVPTEGNLTEYRNGDVLIGNIRPYLKKIWHADRIGGTNGDVLVIHPKDVTINPKYLYQVLADDKFFEYNMQHAKGAKMPRGNKETRQSAFPRRTVGTRQYAYYRDLLLSFPRGNSDEAA